jgi:hypothetical protein
MGAITTVEEYYDDGSEGIFSMVDYIDNGSKYIIPVSEEYDTGAYVPIRTTLSAFKKI